MPLPTRRTETVMDPVAMRVAATYAEALYQAVADDAQAARVLAELRAITDLLDSVDRFEELLTSPSLSPSQRVELVGRIFGGRVSRQTEGLLSVMADNVRLGLLRDVADSFAELLDKREGKVAVEVVTAFPLNRREVDNIADMLRDVLDAEPVVHNTVEKDVIGGVVLKVGDKVYDASIRAELDRLRRYVQQKTGPQPG